MIDETAAGLVARVEHRPLEAEARELGEESEVGLIVGEHHADEADVARQPLQGIAETIERRAVHGELDGIDAHRGDSARARERVLVVRRIAERRARLAPPGHGGERLARGVEWDGPERAPPRVFQIDDVGPELQDDLRLRGVGDAGQHARHRVASQLMRSQPMVSLAARSCRTTHPQRAGGLIAGKGDPIIEPEGKRVCMLRSAPFSRLRLWPHWRPAQSLSPA